MGLVIKPPQAYYGVYVFILDEHREPVGPVVAATYDNRVFEIVPDHEVVEPVSYVKQIGLGQFAASSEAVQFYHQPLQEKEVNRS